MQIPYISEVLVVQCSEYKSLENQHTKPDLSCILTHSVYHPPLFGPTNLRERGQCSNTQNVYLSPRCLPPSASGKTSQ